MLLVADTNRLCCPGCLQRNGKFRVRYNRDKRSDNFDLKHVISKALNYSTTALVIFQLSKTETENWPR